MRSLRAADHNIKKRRNKQMANGNWQLSIINGDGGGLPPTVIPAQAGIQNPGRGWGWQVTQHPFTLSWSQGERMRGGRRRWGMLRGWLPNPPFILRPAQDERLPARLFPNPSLSPCRHSGLRRNAEPRSIPGPGGGRGVDSRFRGNDGGGGGGGRNDGMGAGKAVGDEVNGLQL